MIFIDSNIFVIDLRYKRDPSFRINRRFLKRAADEKKAVTGLANLMEICGILSFNLSPDQLYEFFHYFSRHYGVMVVPAAEIDAVSPRFTCGELLKKIQEKMAYKEAEIPLLALQAAPKLEYFITWNSKHFQGKVPCPVLTPADWLKTASR